MSKSIKLLISFILCSFIVIGLCSCDEPTNPYIENDLYTYKTDNVMFTQDSIVSQKTDGIIYSVRSWAFYESEMLDDDFQITLTFTIDDVADNAGILFGATDPNENGFYAYAAMIDNGVLSLLSISPNDSEKMYFKLIEKVEIDSAVNGNETYTIKLQYRNPHVHICVSGGTELTEPALKCTIDPLPGRGVGIADNGYGIVYSEPQIASDTSDGFKYTNPVFTEYQAADPCVIYHDGVYYCYATSAAVGYRVYTSTDMVTWEDGGLCCDAVWGFDTPRGMYWAPEVIEKDGKFYMVLTVEEKLGFAVADSPLGPFIPEESWVMDKAIDGHFFIDDDGQAYLYYVKYSGKYGIYGCELEDDMVTLRTETEKLLIYPTLDWETVEGYVTEGPYMLKHKGTYYLTYSGTGYTSEYYSVGYAVSDSPLGDFVKKDKPILTLTDDIYGPGHHSFTYSPDGSELFIIYHAHRTPSTDGSGVHPRVLCIDRAAFVYLGGNEDTLYIYGPTSTPQDYPK